MNTNADCWNPDFDKVFAKAIPKTILFNNLRDQSYSSYYQTWLGSINNLSAITFVDLDMADQDIVTSLITFWKRVGEYKNYDQTTNFYSKICNFHQSAITQYFTNSMSLFMDYQIPDDISNYEFVVKRVET